MEESRKVYGWLVRGGNAEVECSSMWADTMRGEYYCGNLLWQSSLTLLFPGCSVLDIGDKGNHYSNLASHSASPGLKWCASAGASALLGYCWKAPLDNQGGVQIINSWCANRSSLGDVAAWMAANDCRSGRNACAILRIDEAHIAYHYYERIPLFRIYNKKTEIVEVTNEN